MFGPKLRHPDQPLWMRTCFGLFEFCSSLKLAVILIFACAVALGWATFVESGYGTPAVQFGVYGTWWFALLNFLLALNIFCAAAIRYPWKRHQTGFVITHLGLLVLLFGCLIQRQRGIDAQMPIFEGQMEHRAFEDSHHFELAVTKKAGSTRDAEIIPIPFAAGPFNWEDYYGRLNRPIGPVNQESPALQAVANGFARLSGFAFRLASRDMGTIYDHDGIKLEVLDYYSDSTEIDAPMIKLRMTSPRMMTLDADNRPVEGPEQWVPVELSVMNQKVLGHKFGIAGRADRGGGSITFGLAGSDAEFEAFLHTGPQGPLGDKGVVVFYVDKKPIQISVDEHLGKGKFPLGNTRLQAEIVKQLNSAKLSKSGDSKSQWVEDASSTKADNPMVFVQVFKDDKPLSELQLFADFYEVGKQDAENHIFASYWFDHKADTSEQRMRGEARSRIDILQAPYTEGNPAKLAYRYWNGKKLVFAEPLPTDGTPVRAFEMSQNKLKLVVDELIPAPVPQRKIIPLPFDAKKMTMKTPAAKVRLTVDGKTDEFWLAAIPGFPIDRDLLPAEKRELESDRRVVTLTLPPDEVDVGFGVRLKDFERKLDPGTSQASHFTSVVDFIDLKTQKPLQTDVIITMNAPVDFSDPQSGRSYRLFQESFAGPIRPGDPEYDKYAAESGADEIYMSTLTVNLDPGRAVKYSGCLLVVAGIATMFYMRAYFFKPSAKRPPAAAQKKSKPKREPVGAGR